MRTKTRRAKERPRCCVVALGRSMPVMDPDLFALDKWKAVQVYRAQLMQIIDMDMRDFYVYDTALRKWRMRRPYEMGYQAKRITTHVYFRNDGAVRYQFLSKMKAMDLICKSFITYGDAPPMDEKRRMEVWNAFKASPWCRVLWPFDYADEVEEGLQF